MNKVIIAVVVILLIAGIGGYWWMNKSQMSTTEQSMSPSPEAMTSSPSDTMMAPSSPSSNSAMTEGVKTFVVANQGLKFNPSELKVKKGDKVKITFNDTMGGHDLKIDEFKVGTKMLKAGESDSIEFTADKTGTFVYYCSVPGHKQAGMWGNLIVE
jgi:plastocyanin